MGVAEIEQFCWLARKKNAAYLRIFCRFSNAARLQKSRLQPAKVFGIGLHIKDIKKA